MRHLKKTKKLKRTQEERTRLKKDLIRALVKNKKIVTFSTRARWFRPFFERLVTLCKRAGDDKQLAYRLVRPYLDEAHSRILIEEIVPKLAQRNGGYTRQLKYFQDFSMHDKSVIMITD